MRISHVLIPILSLCLAACGGGGGGSGSTGGQSSQSSILVPKGVAVLYVSNTIQTGGSADRVIHTIRQFVPATGELLTIDVEESFSFARSNNAIFTNDDQLLLLRNSGSSGTDSGDWTVIDTDAVVDKSLDNEFQPTLVSFTTSEGTPTPYCVAASPVDLYWRNASGALMNFDLSGLPTTMLEQQLIASGNPNVCLGAVFTIDSLNRTIGGMDFADSQFYGAQYDDSSGQMDFYSRNQSTGVPTLLNSVLPSDHASYNPGYSISFDAGLAYFARVSNAGQLEIWSYDFSNPPQLVGTPNITGITIASVSGLDVDDGHLVMRLLEQGATAFDSTNILYFDSNTMSGTIFDLHDIIPPSPGALSLPTYGDVRIMYRQP